MNIQKGFGALRIIFVLALLMFVGGVGWFYVNNRFELPDDLQGTDSLKVYKNEKAGYEFKYPSSWVIEDDTNSELLGDSVNIFSSISLRESNNLDKVFQPASISVYTAEEFINVQNTLLKSNNTSHLKDAVLENSLDSFIENSYLSCKSSISISCTKAQIRKKADLNGTQGFFEVYVTDDPEGISIFKVHLLKNGKVIELSTNIMASKHKLVVPNPEQNPLSVIESLEIGKIFRSFTFVP